jgi:hypothetical protein
LGDPQLGRGARDVFLLRHGDEVTQVPQFHDPPSLTKKHNGSKNIAFHEDRRDADVAISSHCLTEWRTNDSDLKELVKTRP